MGKYLLKDQRIFISFAFEPEYGLRYGKAEFQADILLQPFQSFLGIVKDRENISIYFLWSKGVTSPKIRVLGPLLDKVLPHNAGPKLLVNIQFDNQPVVSIAAKDMDAAFDSLGRCYYEKQIGNYNTILKSNCLVGSVTIEVVKGGGYNLNGFIHLDSNSISKKLLDEQKYTDFVLVSTNGTEFPCLKAFLKTSSTVFDAMLEADFKETREGICKLDISEEGVKALLNYIYCSNVDDPLKKASVALELLETGHKYNIASLEAAMKNVFLIQPGDWLSIDDALLLYRHSIKLDGYDDLKMKALHAIKSKASQLVMSKVFDETIKKTPNMAKKLVALALQI